MCILFDSKHAASVTLGVAHAKRNITLARTCNELLLRLKCNFHVSAHHVFGHAGNAGNECADVAASLGMRGFIFENNVHFFLARETVFVQRLFEIPHCLSRIAEVLHSFIVRSQPGQLHLCCCFPWLFFSQLRSILLCASLVLYSAMSDEPTWTSAQIPHPF